VSRRGIVGSLGSCENGDAFVNHRGDGWPGLRGLTPGRPPAAGTAEVKDSTVLKNVALNGADIYNLGALALDDSTVGVIGP
jgi:hypothetical protein